MVGGLRFVDDDFPHPAFLTVILFPALGDSLG